jgi:hypothetical protein
MMRIANFLRDGRGSLRETTALIATAIAILGVGAATSLDRLTRDGGLPRIAFIPPAAQVEAREDRLRISPPPGQLDDMPVASIPDQASRPILLDPCTGEQK